MPCHRPHLGPTHHWLGLRITATLASLLLMFIMTGCNGERFDGSRLYKGMDRSTIIARYGQPDARKRHGNAERLTYRDGKHYQYLLMLIDDRLEYWEHERVYTAKRYSSIRDWTPTEK
ncbi:MAG: hypothetical protein Kow00105_14520 [Phycisphaeraceae bacterium]